MLEWLANEMLILYKHFFSPDIIPKHVGLEIIKGYDQKQRLMPLIIS